MKQIYPDLWQTSEQRQFSTLTAHGYLLVRPEGNALFYNPQSTDDFGAFTDLGGVKFNYLSHCHEVSGNVRDTSNYFGAQLCGHSNLKRYFDAANQSDCYFSNPEGEVHSRSIEVIHAPGHTDSNVCYRYRSPHGKTYLFVGDTIYLDNGTWNAIVVSGDGGERLELADTLRMLRDVDIDVIVPSVAVGESRAVEISRSEWHGIIDPILQRLER